MERAYYSDTIQGFLADQADTILGKLVSHSEFSVDLSERDAWRAQIIQLQSVLKHQRGAIHFEYAIPRMGNS